MFEAQAALAVNPMARRLAPTGDGGHPRKSGRLQGRLVPGLGFGHPVSSLTTIASDRRALFSLCFAAVAVGWCSFWLKSQKKFEPLLAAIA